MNVRDKKYQCKEPNCLNFISYQNFKYRNSKIRRTYGKQKENQSQEKKKS
jgi:hypothetical protein